MYSNKFDNEKVKRLMVERNISLKELAKNINSTEKTLRIYLNGKKELIRSSYVEKIAHVLNVDFDEFILGLDELICLAEI